jgi:SAM-dependent methyltransferase
MIDWVDLDTRVPLSIPSGTGLIRGAAGPYGQVGNVPVLTRAGVDAECERSLPAAIARGGRGAAIDWLEARAAAEKQPLGRLSRIVSQGGAGQFLDEWTAELAPDDGYFAIRWACPSYLSILPLLPYLVGRTVLDGACGAGHLLQLLSSIQPASTRIGLDLDPIHALIARGYFDPESQTAAADLDDRLPLPNGCADVAIVVDAFHYLERKDRFLDEAFRVLRGDAELILVHVHDPRNLKGERAAGHPIAPAECAALLRDACPAARVALVTERDLLDTWTRGRLIPWQHADDLRPGPYTLRAVRGVERPAASPNFERAANRCFVNPIYRETPARLWLRWCSRGAEREFGATPLPPFLPRQQRFTHRERLALLAKGVLVSDPWGRVASALARQPIPPDRE